MNADDGIGAVESGHAAAVLTVFDSLRYRTVWTCEKWSEEACAFVRRQLGLARSANVDVAALRQLVGAPEELLMVEGNLILNAGITRLLNLGVGLGGTAFDAANAYIGVGDSTTAASASQTDLQASSNKFWRAMAASYPLVSAQTVTWQSSFGSSDANYAWQEWGVSAGASGASGDGFTTVGTLLNRKVASLGTKVTGTWTLTGSLGLS